MKKTIYLNKQKPGDIVKQTPSISRLDLVRKLFGPYMSNAFTVNIAGVIALLPILVIVIIYAQAISKGQFSLPYSSSVGFGYPVIADVFDIAFKTQLDGFYSTMLFFLPLAVTVSVFLLVHVFYGARNFVWREGDVKVKDFFRSFKFNSLQGLFLALISGVATLVGTVLVYLFKTYTYLNGYNFVAIAWLVAMIAAGVLFFMLLLQAISLSITYKLSFAEVLVGSWRITFSTFIFTLSILLVMFCAIALAFISTFFSTLVMMLYLFIGVAFAIVVWTVYSQYLFDTVHKREEKEAKSKKN